MYLLAQILNKHFNFVSHDINIYYFTDFLNYDWDFNQYAIIMVLM